MTPSPVAASGAAPVGPGDLGRRISIVGTSGVGKSTVAAQLADRLGVDVVELDALAHGPGWVPTPTPTFRASVLEALEAAEASSGGWVVPGNFANVADLVARRADTIVWLDLPLPLTLARLVRRSVGRAVRRDEVGGGNRERLRDLVSRDPERNVVRWAWQHHGAYRERFERAARPGGLWDGARSLRLRTRREVAELVSSAGAGPGE